MSPAFALSRRYPQAACNMEGLGLAVAMTTGQMSDLVTEQPSHLILVAQKLYHTGGQVKVPTHRGEGVLFGVFDEVERKIIVQPVGFFQFCQNLSGIVQFLVIGDYLYLLA